MAEKLNLNGAIPTLNETFPKLTWETPTPTDMHVNMYMIINVAIGNKNSWSGAPNARQTWFDWMRIKSVRVWQRPEYA